MATLKKRNHKYYIRFFRTVDGIKEEKQFSLGTTNKREAEKQLINFEELYERGEIDPFNGWTPKDEAEKKRQSLTGKYISLEDAAKDFISVRSQANQRTKDNYEKHLRMLMDQVGRTMPVNQITEGDIRDFCFKSDLAPSTQRSYLTHLKVFFKWLFEQKILKQNLTKDIKPPRIPQKITQKTVTREQLDKIFEAFDKHYAKHEKTKAVSKPEQRRLWFKPMIETIYYCGLRAKEAVNLIWKDVIFKKPTKKKQDYGVIIVRNTNSNTTKSGMERLIPIRKPLYKRLQQWHKDQGKPNDGYVFPSATGWDEWSKMDSGALSKSYKKFVKLAKNVPNTPNLHGLRHSCATDLLAKGVSPVVVQKIMGHSDINTTMIYEHLDANNIINALSGIDE